MARTGVCFAIELMMDAIAREVGREPWEVRYENLVPASAMPYNNVANKHYDSGDYQASLKRAVEMIDFAAVRARQQQGEADGRLIGVGFATYHRAVGARHLGVRRLGPAGGAGATTRPRCKLTPDGGLEVRVGVHSHGQGMETTMAQIANEILGVPVARIRVVHGDTGATPYSTGTYASRSHRDGGRRGVARPARCCCRACAASAPTCCGQPEDGVRAGRRRGTLRRAER